MKPLVSILIPAYNSREVIIETLKSALAQTWSRKEIIVVDDGSRDDTAAVARSFESAGVKVVVKENAGAATARNHAYSLAQGDYIQWLDADDLLSPNKVEDQLTVLELEKGRRLLASGPWGYFRFRPRKARFISTPLWADLSPLEWMIRKMGQNLHMQTATWLTPRELAEAAGPWNSQLLSDDDGEYFCRVLLASEGTRFVPESKVFYRIMPTKRLSYIGNSDPKKSAMLASMKIHISSLRSLEESERVRGACLDYINNWLIHFYPERKDILTELEELAKDLGGQLNPPSLSWKYSWMVPLFGWKSTKQVQTALPNFKSSLLHHRDRLLSKLETPEDMELWH